MTAAPALLCSLKPTLPPFCKPRESIVAVPWLIKCAVPPLAVPWNVTILSLARWPPLLLDSR